MTIGKCAAHLLIILGFGCVLGCVTTEPLVVDLESFSPNESPAGPQGCIIHIDEILDERTSKNDLGSIGPRVVQTGDVMPWIRRAIESVTNGSIKHTSGVGDQVQPHRVDLKARLRKLYVHTLLTSISANVLLVMSYSVDESPPETHAYRGRETSVNWTGSAEFVAGLLDDALADALQRLRVDLQHRCSSKPL